MFLTFAKGSNLESIESLAFYHCTSLSSFDFPDSLREIGETAFARAAFTSLELPEGMTSISNAAFTSCIKLDVLTLPSTITEIQDRGFEFAPLSTIHFRGSKHQWEAITGEGKPSKEPTDYAKYDISFDSNNGSGEVRYQSGINTVTLDGNTFTYDGFLFKEWNSKEDGSGTAYKDRDSFDLYKDETLYAQWVKDISKAVIISDATLFTYNGQSQSPNVKVVADGKELEKDVHYTRSLSHPISADAGEYKLTIEGKGEYGGTATVSYSIKQAENSLDVSGKTARVKYKKLKKKNQTLARSKILNEKTQGKGEITYSLLSAKKGKKSFKKKFYLDSKSGKLTIKKKLAKGTYKLNVQVKAAGTGNHKAAGKNVTVKIIVK